MVEAYFNLEAGSIHINTRKREVVQARQIAMFFCKTLTKSSLATIGANIGNKDHATVLHACKTVHNLIDTDKLFRADIYELQDKISQYLLFITEEEKMEAIISNLILIIKKKNNELQQRRCN